MSTDAWLPAGQRQIPFFLPSPSKRQHHLWIRFGCWKADTAETWRKKTYQIQKWIFMGRINSTKRRETQECKNPLRSVSGLYSLVKKWVTCLSSLHCRRLPQQHGNVVGTCRLNNHWACWEGRTGLPKDPPSLTSLLSESELCSSGNTRSHC